MRASHALAAAAAALLLAGLVASRGDLGDRSADPAQPVTPSAGASASPPRTGGGSEPTEAATPQVRRTVTVAGVDLVVTATTVTTGEPRPDDTRHITVSGTVAYTTATPGADLVEHTDDSVTVLRDGTPVAALTPERGPAAASGPGVRTLALGDTALESATWAERQGEGGRSLAVVPEPWVRHGGEATLDLLTAQLAAVEPETDSDTMRDQLACHHLGAPDKASWNLEPWRPDAGTLGTIAARCNPTES